ncbi:MAG: hypothetical protein AAGD38_12475 [Acidobacteriota bacterium]
MAPQPTYKLSLLPFPQRWRDGVLTLRLVVLPRGNPLAPLMPGGPAFVDGELGLEAALIPGLDRLPRSADVTDRPQLDLATSAVRRQVFTELAAQLDIDPNLDAGIANPRRAGRQIKKFLPMSYRQSFSWAGPRNPWAVIDDEYACALRNACRLRKPPVPATTTIAWGQAVAYLLRQPVAAIAGGIVYETKLEPSANVFANGGWLYLGLRPGTAWAAQTAAQPDLLATWAARIPPLQAERPLFAPVLFPIADPPPAGDYDELFAEVASYDDGFAKVVYCDQARTSDPAGAEGERAGAPITDTGIQIGWDDEQLLDWMNRQILDPAVETRNSPLGTYAYRIDVRKVGDAAWHPLTRASADSLRLGGLDLGGFDGELNVHAAPLNLDAEEGGIYWLPSYFTQWEGWSLVVKDPLSLEVSGAPTDVGHYKAVGPEVVPLRYGESYETRVRLVDLSGGGPNADDQAVLPAPAPHGRCDFRRFISPGPVGLLGIPENLDPAAPPTELSLSRPTLSYPQAIFADVPDARQRLRDAVAAIRGGGIEDVAAVPDVDVDAVRITVRVAGLDFDDVNDVEGTPPERTLYSVVRAFPVGLEDSLVLGIDYVDVPDIDAMVPPAADQPLTVPRARDVTLVFEAVGRDDPGLAYFGSDASRFGRATEVTLRAAPVDERGLFAVDLAGDRLRAMFLRPDAVGDAAYRARLRASGRGEQAEDDLLGRFAEELDIAHRGLTFSAQAGERCLFGCSKEIAHILSPDRSGIAVGAKAELADRWIVAVSVRLARDWTWDGLETDGIRIARDGSEIGHLHVPRAVNPTVLARNDRGRAAERGTTRLIFFDAVDPKAIPPAHPAERSLTYTVSARFVDQPAQSDPALDLDIDLPIAAPPTQTPELVSAGVALSPYERDEVYSRTGDRERYLWLEFAAPPDNPADSYFARVLTYAPDPMLTGGEEVEPPPEPPLPVDPEAMRVIRPGQADDRAGLAAMQQLIATDSPRHFIVPLPPGLYETSRELFGFFTYEVRLGHAVGWSTARARFGPALRVTGVRHPSPSLTCTPVRDGDGVRISADYATPVWEGRNLRQQPPATELWGLLYAQVNQVDGTDHRNILLGQTPMSSRLFRELIGKGQRNEALLGGLGSWRQDQIETALERLGLATDSPLSVLAVELLPEAVGTFPDPLGRDLGEVRILRTSSLIPVPAMCIQPPCPHPPV